MLDEDGVHRLVGEIYDAALAPERWSAMLERIGDAFGGAAVTSGLWEAPDKVHRFEGVRVNPDSVTRFIEHYRTPETNHTLHWIARMPLAEPVPFDTFQSYEEFERTDLYNDIYRPDGHLYNIVSVLIRTPTLVAPFGVLRGRRTGPFDAEELRLLRLLFPHLRRSMEMFVRLGLTQDERDATATVLDRVPLGVILADANGVPLRLNRTAEQILGAADGLTTADGKLSAARPSEAARLLHCIAAAAACGRGAGASAEGALSISRPSLRRDLSVQVVPLPVTSPLGEYGRAAVAVFVGDPERAAEPPEALLTRLYSFTPMEAKIAALLMAGHDIGGMAASLGISGHTVRSHLKNAFAKTGTRRQTELLRLLLRSPAGFDPG